MNTHGSITDQVRQMVPARYTVKQAAELVGRSTDTLNRWRKDEVFVPSDSKDFGSLTVYLYSDQDIADLRQLAKTVRPGPKAVSA